MGLIVKSVNPATPEEKSIGRATLLKGVNSNDFYIRCQDERTKKWYTLSLQTGLLWDDAEGEDPDYWGKPFEGEVTFEQK